mmetsp:Transcript_56179/g.122122  ORF Transcript_56179/g.122122 Transcript_56179/m.122122 type:complete len:212 (+) Transcript_56179:690-1325(+)
MARQMLGLPCPDAVAVQLHASSCAEVQGEVCVGLVLGDKLHGVAIVHDIARSAPHPTVRARAGQGLHKAPLHRVLVPRRLHDRPQQLKKAEPVPGTLEDAACGVGMQDDHAAVLGHAGPQGGPDERLLHAVSDDTIEQVKGGRLQGEHCAVDFKAGDGEVEVAAEVAAGDAEAQETACRAGVGWPHVYVGAAGERDVLLLIDDGRPMHTVR